jgi:glutamine amidotransferase
MKVAIIDYGMGNIKSIVGALKYLKVENISVTNNIQSIAISDKLILPGVGSFSKAMENIKKLNIDKNLKSAVDDGKPILGICLGMQLMGESSIENGYHDGLGFVRGSVHKFTKNNLKVPHIGFNQVDYPKNSKLFRGIDNYSDFYFVHSFKMISDSNINQSVCHYGEDFIASYEKDNIAGVQFHPELSQVNGLKLLNNFINLF